VSLHDVCFQVFADVVSACLGGILVMDMDHLLALRAFYLGGFLHCEGDVLGSGRDQ